MCLAIPMQILSIEESRARCEAKGIVREVSLFLLPPGSVAPGDYVMVHVGYAIQRVDAAAAHAARALHAELQEGGDA